MKKTIDVIIPAYNAEKFIERTMRSVVFQTLPPEKIIVVDDGSTDGTVNVIKEFAKTSNIQIQLHLQENRGPNAARNEGLRHADSEFVAFLDADDVWTKNKLERQIEVFEKTEFEKLGLVYTAYDLIDEHDVEVKYKFLVFKLNTDMRGHVFDKMFDAMKITGSSSGVLIKRDCFRETGFFDETLKGAEDWDMWLRISENFSIDYVNEVLVHVRMHDGNSHKDQLSMAENIILLLKKWHAVLDIHHHGRQLLAVKSFDYFFKALFMLKLKLACDILKKYRSVLTKDEHRKIFTETRGSVVLFMLLYFPAYVKKQVRRMI